MTGYVPGNAIPDTAAGQVEFVSLTGYNPGSELNGAAGGGGFDPPFYRRYVAALEEAGFDCTLNGYGSSTADSFIVSIADQAGRRHQNIWVTFRPIIAETATPTSSRPTTPPPRRGSRHDRH
jgi:alkanesulfonate monooxygenase